MAESYEIVYWPGFTGRAQPLMFLLEAANVKYTWNTDVVGFKEANNKAGFPLFACPFLKQGEFVISQTHTIMEYLGKKHGFAVEGEQATFASVVSLNVADIWSEGYNARKSAADKGATFLKERLGAWLDILEGEAAKTAGKFFFADGASYVDFVLLNLDSTLDYLYGKKYQEQRDSRKKICEILNNTKNIPGVAAHIASDSFLPVLYDGVKAEE
mmetsp:Transcript_23087/g.31586  ORF Transcript_23087/g.31586 Transcript_23087/m.31586 type:complete len:214 (-) Transcript_23087:66-707(-)|eukprot:CAMPEP_0201489792 /NCGR_PEP_ID=MMETSP0151_2-20130828/23730_1 /ASSEMBLY_ACC=CAM_ASM_000257 /TAXON_ID=200890 /ORGANISM="Paramoeba atlantica, Strain 621/1 / CCAP 1560/9" /LENGTH=213 /DNA_ID=CAMNT_0047875487 /DNA_START=85 /DNA_END=726 /DNA_ORIENTATION=+